MTDKTNNVVVFGKPMKKFDKGTVRVLRQQLEQAMVDFSRETGLNIDVGNARFDEHTIDFKLQVSLVDPETRLPMRLVKVANKWNMALDVAPEGCRLVDYRPENKKYPFIYEQDGSRYKITLQKALMMFSPDWEPRPKRPSELAMEEAFKHPDWPGRKK